MDGFLGSNSQISVKINDIEISYQNIKEFNVRESIFNLGCELEMTFMDFGVFAEVVPICDTSIAEVQFSFDRDNILNIPFKIFTFEFERSMLDGGAVYFWKILAVQTSNSGKSIGIQTRAFPGMSSGEVFQTLATEMGFELEQVIPSQDTQTWHQINIGNYTFLRNVLKRAFVGRRDLPISYVTKTGKLIYTSLNSLCEKTPRYTLLNYDMFTQDGQDPIINKLKSDFKEDVLFYRTGVAAKNFSSIKNYVGSYGSNFTYFDGENLREVSLKFPAPSLTKTKNRDASKTNLYDSHNYGLRYGNVHENYMLAINQNKYISDSFFSSYINLVVEPDFTLSIGDKVNMVYIRNLDRYLKGEPGIDETNSGEYIIGNILHNIVPNGPYTMVVTLFRDGLNLNSKVSEKLGLYEQA